MLTAAHCFRHYQNDKVSNWAIVPAKYGIHCKSNKSFNHDIESIELHGEYDEETAKNDIAILTIEGKFKFVKKNIDFIELYSKNVTHIKGIC